MPAEKPCLPKTSNLIGPIRSSSLERKIPRQDSHLPSASSYPAQGLILLRTKAPYRDRIISRGICLWRCTSPPYRRLCSPPPPN